MPLYANVPGTLPAPAAVILTGPEGEINATKIIVTRPGTITHLSAFVEGSGGGANTDQGGKLALYSHNGGTPGRPLTKLGECAEVRVRRNDPITGKGPIPLLAPVHVAAGTYWLTHQGEAIAGSGRWNVRGIVGGGDSVLGVAQAYATVPAAFPAGGAASTNRIALGAKYTPDPQPVSGGAIVGTFIVGDGTLVGEQATFQMNEGGLLLDGKAFITNVFGNLSVVQVEKSSLVLNGKQVMLDVASSLVMGKPALVLKGKQTFVVVPIQMHMAKPWLTLRGKAFITQTDSIMVTGKPKLILNGKAFFALIPGLFPTTPVDVDLVPTDPVAVDLTPTTPESIDLIPTTEEFR